MTVVSGQSKGAVEVTPSGIPVYYQSAPKRLYRIRGKDYGGDTENRDWLLASAQREHGEDEGWSFEGWREVPSVTTVLGVLDKPALPWWGMRVGVEGFCTLVRDGAPLPSEWSKHPDKLIDLLTERKLTVNHVRDQAGDRGQAVHDAFEAWARTGFKPDPQIYPEEQRGYIDGLLAFLADVPSIEPIAVEVLVASAEYGYAGRYDIRFRTSQEHEVVVKRGKRKIETRVLPAGLCLGDLKTSKGIYPSHARQLEAYEQASIESGYDPTEARGILHVGADGTYEFVRSWATFEDFRVVLDVWNSDQEMRARK